MSSMRSLSVVGRDFVRMIEKRVHLVVAEFQLERMRFLRFLLLSVLGATLLGSGSLVLTALLVHSVAEENRGLVLGIASTLLLCSAAFCIGVGLHYIYGNRTPFKSSTEVLKEDADFLISQFKK